MAQDDGQITGKPGFRGQQIIIRLNQFFLIDTVANGKKIAPGIIEGGKVHPVN